MLLCEDDDGVRVLLERILEGAGFELLPSRLPREALQLAADHHRPVDLLVTDVVLPEMSGLELAGRLRQRRPGLRTLFVTGHSLETVQEFGELPPGSAFLAKPFDGASVVRLARDLIEGRA